MPNAPKVASLIRIGRVARLREEEAVRQAKAPRMELTQEVRFAVVMYGGISLAIYMNGVAQEFRKMVRATAPRGDDEHHAALDDGELDGPTEKVYRKLGRMLSWGAVKTEDPANVSSDDPIRTRFVVDILSGSSDGESTQCTSPRR